MRMIRYTTWGALALGIATVALSGCQTHTGGMTLPSPHYLKHSPQYFPPDPAFPLQRERDSMLDPDGALRRGAVAPAVGPGPLAPGMAPINPGQVAPPAPAN